MRNDREYVKKRLKSFSKNDVIITPHAEIRMHQRQINKDEVIGNIVNPIKLEYALKQKAERADEEKFDCYFGYSKSRCHRYIIVIKGNVVVVTIIKINRRWQKIVETKLKKGRLQ